MRAVMAVLALAAALSLSGCIWWSDSVDESDPYEPEFALVLLAMLVLVGVVLVVVNLSNNAGQSPPQQPFPPPQPPPPAPPHGGWQEVDHPEAPPLSTRPRTRAAPKTARRRAP